MQFIHQFSPCHELGENDGFANFKLLLVIQKARDMAQISGKLSYKVRSTFLRKFLITELFFTFLVNPPSSASACWCLMITSNIVLYRLSKELAELTLIDKLSL